VPFGSATADFVVDRNVLSLEPLDARDGEGELVVRGQVAWGGALGKEYRLTGLTTESRSWPVERILSFLALDLPISGRVTGRLPLDGVTPRVVGSADLRFEGARVWGQRFDRLEGTMGFEPDRLRLTGVKGSLGAGAARLDGSFLYDDDGYEVEASAEGLPLEGLEATAGAEGALTGLLSGSLSGRGTLDAPRLEVRGAVGRPAWAGSPLALPGRDPRLSLSLDGAALEAELDAPGAALLRASRRGPETVVGLEVRSLAAYLPLLGVPPESGLDGTAKLEVTLEEGPDGAMRAASGRLAELDATTGPHELFLAAPAPFRWSDGQLAWEDARLAARRATGTAGPLPEGEASLSGSIQTGDEGRLSLRASGAFEAALLRPFLGEAEVEGRMAAKASVSGTRARPVVEGRIDLDGLELVTAPGATPVERITGTLQLSPGRIATDGLTMRWNGNVGVAGVLTLDGLDVTGHRLNVRLDGVRSQPFPGLRTTVSGDLVLLGDDEIRSARGELAVDRGVYDQDLDLSLQALLGSRRGGAEAPPEPTRFDDVSLEVRVALPPGSIEVRNNVARMKGSGDLNVRGTFRQPLLLGSIEATEGGRLELRGLKYDVTRAKLVFANPARNDPYFELEAHTQVKEYAITLGVSGTASRIVPRFSSYPQLPEAQIVSILATGEVPSTTAGTVGSVSPVSTDQDIVAAARELITGLATDAAASRTKEFLRLDRLQIDPVFIGSTFDAPRLTVAKRLSKELAVTYSYKASTDQEQVILVEYQISPSAFVQLLRDENGVYSAEVKIRQRLR
jgi:translocation and assembly module TamB